MEKVNLRVPLSSLKKRSCKCGSENFVPAINIYEISAILSPNGKDGVVFSDPHFLCLSCGEPADLKAAVPAQETATPEKSNLIIIGDKEEEIKQ